jgi:hypothetical protein
MYSTLLSISTREYKIKWGILLNLFGGVFFGLFEISEKHLIFGKWEFFFGLNFEPP